MLFELNALDVTMLALPTQCVHTNGADVQYYW